MNTDQRPEDASDPSPEAEDSQPEAAAPEVEASQPKTAPPHTPEAETSEPEPEAPPAPEAEASEPEAAAPPPLAEASVTTESGLSKDSLNMGMLCHLLALTALITAGAGAILGPLIIWLLKKESDPYVDEQGKESLNFQISMAIYAFVAGLLMMVVIGIILLPIVILAWLVLTIIGTIKASKGEPWKYPITIRMIK